MLACLLVSLLDCVVVLFGCLACLLDGLLLVWLLDCWWFGWCSFVRLVGWYVGLLSVVRVLVWQFGECVFFCFVWLVGALVG